MRLRHVAVALASLVAPLGIIVPAAHAGVDDLPPTVSDFMIAPSTVDVTSSSQTVTLSVHLADPSGVLIYSSSTADLSTTIGLAGIGASGWTQVSGSDTTDGVWEATATIPRGLPASTWTAHTSFLADGAGNWSSLDHASSPLTVTDSDPDTLAPAVTDLSASPSTVDVSDGPQQVTLSAHLADPSGISTPGAMTVTSDTGRQYGTIDLTRVSGTTTDGVWQATATVPAGVPPGTWTVTYTGAGDAFGNVVLTTASTAFGVTDGDPDTAAPVVQSVELDSTTVDVTSTEAQVTVTVHATDDTGIAWVSAGGTLAGVPGYELSVGLSRVSGTARDGVYRGTAWIPEGIPAGIYEAVVSISDTLGNTDSDAATTPLTIINDPTSPPGEGAGPPVVVAFSATPVDVTDGASSTTVSLHLTDTAGVSNLGVQLQRPDGTYVSAIPVARTSGTSSDGIWTGSVTIPTGAPGGEWSAVVTYVLDNAGNENDALPRASISVTDADPDVNPPIVTIEPLSPVDATTDAADVTVRVHIADPSGVADVSGAASVLLVSDMTEQSVRAYLHRVGGTATDGTWQGTVTIPRGSAAGGWTGYVRDVSDTWGNTLLAAGPAAVTVVDETPDTSPPMISDMAVTPTTVDISGGSTLVTVTARLTDSSGVETPYADFTSPYGDSRPSFTDVSLVPVAGSTIDWTLTAVAAIPPTAAVGAWTVDVGGLADQLGNRDDESHSVTFTVTRGDAPPSTGSGDGTPGDDATGSGGGAGGGSTEPTPSSTPTAGPTPTPSPAPTPTPTPTPSPSDAVTAPSPPSRAPSVSGKTSILGAAKAGGTVHVAKPRFHHLPRRAKQTVTWYVDGRAVHTGSRLKLKPSWQGARLSAKVTETWHAVVASHGRKKRVTRSLSRASRSVTIG